MKPARPAFGPLPDAGGRFHWTAAARSHVGRVREVNEDACLDWPERGLWAVADGMGGHHVGDFASRTVVAALSDVPVTIDLAQSVAAAKERLQIANRRLRTEAASRRVPMIGSTVVVLMACDDQCGYLWAGDSRLYLYRQGRLRLLTRDHSLIEELKSRGQLASDAIHHRACHGVTRAIGAVDVLDLDGATVAVEDGDMFVLCSDGLSNAVADKEMVDALVPGDCRRAADALIDMALDRGGRDNISAVVVRAEDLNADRTLFNPALW